MTRRFAAICMVVGFVLLASGMTNAAEEETPLGRGWLSLDCCVGPLDNAIANGKGAPEKALGIGISGYLDTGYTWSSNHPRSSANISGRYFDKDYNKIEFNDFHNDLDKRRGLSLVR